MFRRILLLVLVALILTACGTSDTPATPDAGAIQTAIVQTQVAQAALASPTPAPSATPKPTNTPAPTATPKPTSTPKPTVTPKPASLTVKSFGFGQSSRLVGYALIIENPAMNMAMNSTKYQVAAYDAAGTVIATAQETLYAIFPGQTIAQAGDLIVPEGAVVDHIEVQMGKGTPAPMTAVDNAMEPFPSQNVAFQPGSYGSNDVTGEITNLLDKDASTLRVSAVVYDASDKIIGGGYTYLDFLPASGKSAVSVPVKVQDGAEVARAELYAVVTILTKLE